MLEFGTNQENYPARADAQSKWLCQLQAVGEYYNTVNIGVLQESINPQDRYSRPTFHGGKAVGYVMKYITYITAERGSHTPSTEKRPDHVREFWIMRHPSKKEWTTYGEFGLANDGYTDYER
jgi:hypothetical protein